MTAGPPSLETLPLLLLLHSLSTATRVVPARILKVFPPLSLSLFPAPPFSPQPPSSKYQHTHELNYMQPMISRACVTHAKQPSLLLTLPLLLRAASSNENV